MRGTSNNTQNENKMGTEKMSRLKLYKGGFVMSDYLGKDVFKLGFGLMRLPKNEDGSIDIAQTSEMNIST